MAKTSSFDVTRNLSGLSSFNNFNNEKPDDKKYVEREEKSKPSVETTTQEKPSKSQEKTSNFNTLLIPVEKKEKKTMHKNFLMTEKRFNQFKELAKSRGQSENALFNDILTQLFGEE